MGFRSGGRKELEGDGHGWPSNRQFPAVRTHYPPILPIRGADANLVDEVYALPPHLRDLERAALADSSAGRPAEALRGFETILAIEPSHPASQFNRIVALAQLKRTTVAEQVAALRDLLEQTPRYLVARTTLARLLWQEGRIEEARETLKEAHLADAVDADGHAGAVEVLAGLAASGGDLVAARRFAATSRALMGDAVFQERAPDLAALLAATEATLAPAKRRDRQHRKHLQREVAADASTTAWFSHLTVAQLKEALHFHGYRLTGAPRREHLLHELAAVVDEGAGRETADHLRGPCGHIVDALVAAGGKLPWDAAMQRFAVVRTGPIPDDAEEPLDLLLRSGLAVTVAVDGVPSLAMPPATWLALGGRPSSSSAASSSAASSSAASSAAGAVRWQVTVKALPPLGDIAAPVLAVVVDVGTGMVLEGHLHERNEPV